MEAEARTLRQGVALDETKPRVETRPTASASALMKAIQTLDLKFWITLIMVIGMYVTTIVGIITIINTTNERIDALEANLIMHIDGTGGHEHIDRINKRNDTLGSGLNARATNERIDATNKRIDALGRGLNARINAANDRINATHERIDKLR